MVSSSQVPAKKVAERLFDQSRPGIEFVETHVSTIVFDGDLVHKRKKPVRFAFVDLSTPEKREQMCHREVALNGRFSPDVYLGVEDVVNDAGDVVDHAVLMRRMPADRRLAELVRRRVDVSDCVRAVARTIAVCHADLVRSEEISSVATSEALHELWAQNLREMAPFVPRPLDAAIVTRVGELSRRYLDGRGTLLAERIERGLIVDGHGDLLADDIFCLDDGPRVLDGLEFDERLRWGDVLYDVGFLAMDLERLGHLELALALLSWYREFSAETHPRSLEHHYVAYRALVRAKISCLKGVGDDWAEAQAYLAQCERHLRDARVQLVVIGGLPGTGKTTLAAALGDALGWTVLRSDEMRKELAGLDPLTPAPAAYGEGLYSHAATDSTYGALLSRARGLLALGESVVIDASFSRSGWRADAAAVAVDTFADLTELRCVLPLDVAAARLARRQANGGDASDATPAVAAEMADEFEEWPSAATISTVPAPEVILAEAVNRVGGPYRGVASTRPSPP